MSSAQRRGRSQVSSDGEDSQTEPSDNNAQHSSKRRRTGDDIFDVFDVFHHDVDPGVAPGTFFPGGAGVSFMSEHAHGMGPDRCIIIHQVTCTQGSEGHSEHEEKTAFLDHPRLFRGNNKATPLHGKSPVRDVDGYLDENLGAAFAVVRVYDCESYHASVGTGFHRIDVAGLDQNATMRIRPFLWVLDKDGPLATPQSETMRTPSVGMERAVNRIRARCPDSEALFDGWNLESALTAPYLYFYHTRGVMQRYLRDLQDDVDRKHIQTLLTYLQSGFGKEYDEADRLFRDGKVTQHHFSKLFAPNDFVVSDKNGQDIGYQLSKCPKQTEQGGIQLDAYTYEFDGKFRRRDSTFQVPFPSSGLNPISVKKLGVYPLKYAPEMKDKLEKRGRMFWGCRVRKLVSYKQPRANSSNLQAHPRYMVDATVYKQIHAKNEEGEEMQPDTTPSDIDLKEDPEDGNFYLLLPATVKGFGFHDKKWRTLLVEHIDEVKWNKKAFDQLVLDNDKKELIKALVTVHLQSPMPTDIIEGKGNSLIILLHGAPGTGKTLTAESVAEYAERPLYKVTCGDIGTEPDAVEKYLESVFYVASIFSAVLLLDESDVFLEERTKMDLQRNALVSVFLRALEYYDGILILTSNRVGLFDEAFKSRVQLALHYPSLGLRGRKEIWHNFFTSMREDRSQNIDYDDLRRKIEMFADEKLNGRQIRNCITTARQLATFKKEELKASHVDRAIKVTLEFEDYVKDTHGHEDSYYLREQGIRKD